MAQPGRCRQVTLVFVGSSAIDLGQPSRSLRTETDDLPINLDKIVLQLSVLDSAKVFAGQFIDHRTQRTHTVRPLSQT